MKQRQITPTNRKSRFVFPLWSGDTTKKRKFIIYEILIKSTMITESLKMEVDAVEIHAMRRFLYILRKDF